MKKTNCMMVVGSVVTILLASGCKMNSSGDTLGNGSAQQSPGQQQDQNQKPGNTQGQKIPAGPFEDTRDDVHGTCLEKHAPAAQVIDVQTVRVSNTADALAIDLTVKGPIAGPHSEASSREYYCFIDVGPGKPGYVPFGSITYVKADQQFTAKPSENPWPNFYADYLVYYKLNDLGASEGDKPVTKRFHDCERGTCSGAFASTGGKDLLFSESTVTIDAVDNNRVHFNLPLKEIGLDKVPAGQAKTITLGCVTYIKFKDKSDCEDDARNWQSDAAAYPNGSAALDKDVITYSFVR